MTASQGSMISFKRPDGQDVQGYLAKPAKAEGAPGIVVIQEWWGLNDQIRGVADRLARAGYVALVPDLFAKESDFFALGTNDLVQYLLAADRGNEADADYYQPDHPAVMRAFDLVTEAARYARIPVSICGELAGDPNYTELLLRQGIRQFSMPAGNIPLIKERIRNLSVKQKT